jgi:glycosyltransferase involved in cell wall biosynthesis
MIVSIVIPCYRHGAYIREAIQSISHGIQYPYEIIILNDGSPDDITQNVMRELEVEGFRVITHDNMGLAKTRNKGIQLSSGKYILPLDADNKINPLVLNEAIELLEKNSGIDIVYSDRILFGDVSGYDVVGKFNLQKLMLSNYIDACAVYRRSMLDDIGVYDFNMPAMGAEDWDLWIRAAFAGRRFHYLNKAMYEYRLLGESMARTITGPKYGKIKSYMQTKHPEFLGFTIVEDYFTDRFKRKPLQFLVKMILRAWFPATYLRLQEKGKIQDS